MAVVGQRRVNAHVGDRPSHIDTPRSDLIKGVVMGDDVVLTTLVER